MGPLAFPAKRDQRASLDLDVEIERREIPDSAARRASIPGDEGRVLSKRLSLIRPHPFLRFAQGGHLLPTEGWGEGRAARSVEDP